MPTILNPDINITQSNGLDALMKVYYDKKLLKHAKPRLVHQQNGQQRPLPKNSGKTIQFRKWTPFKPIIEPLEEGAVPDGQDLEMTELISTIEQYGGYVAVSDVLDMTALDPVINDSVELMGDQGGLSIDHITRDVICTGTNVQYAGGKAARVEIAQSDKLTIAEIRKAVRTLKKNQAPQFMRNGKGYYKAIVSPDAIFDLQSDPLWQAVAQYQQAEKIEDGEIGKLFGVIFLETSEAKVFKGLGANNDDVHATLVFGRNAYGVVKLDNENMKTIIKPHGSAGTSDPLNQIATVGWKVNGFAAAILQPLWLVRIEHGVSL